MAAAKKAPAKRKVRAAPKPPDHKVKAKPKAKAKRNTSARGAAQPGARAKRTEANRKAYAAKFGRPTTYRPEMCLQVMDIGEEGGSITAIANNLKVDRSTIYDWMDKHPDFAHAIKKAQDNALNWWENILRKQAMGMQGSTTAAIFAMKNQYPEDYRDRREVDLTGELKLVEIDFMGYEEEDDVEGDG